MIGMESNHCQVIRDVLSGQKAIDEKTLASLAILTERLERLKKADKAFDAVCFSSAVRKLAGRKDALAIC